MRISDLLYETWSALMANKGRSLLTVLGIVIGIAAVIAMTSLIGGVKQALVTELGLDQSRVVYIDFWNGGQTTSAADLEAIEDGVEGYEFVTGMQFSGAKASTETKQSDVSVQGVTKGFFQAMGSKLVYGRLLSDKELASDAMVVVVDNILVRSLYAEDENPVGKKLELGNDTYTIVGVVESSTFFGSQGSVYMPIQTCAIRLTGWENFDQIIGYAQEEVDIESLVQRTIEFIKQHFAISDEDLEEGYSYIWVESIASIQQELDSMMMSFQLMMTAVAGISLLVGGIGIMNMMLTNVTERIREIGLRKALGAHKGDITLQFLIESIALCLVGGIIGFALGIAGAYALSAIAGGAMGGMLIGEEGMVITPYVSWTTVLIAISICVGIGIVFGYWPARRAAKLDPVESLRHQ